jgi:hypothetical protein
MMTFDGRMWRRSIVALVVAAGVARAQLPPSGPAPLVNGEQRLFAFHSNFWVNVHHFLYQTARARMGLDASRPATTATLSDTVGFGTLPAEARRGWESALAYYVRTIARRDVLFDSTLVAANNRLADLETARTVLGATGLDAGMATALERAAPAYRALWWPRHDALNHEWIDSAAVLVAAHGAAAAQEESRVFGRPWPAPLRVDVSAYTSWAGAYTTEYPGHVNVSSTVSSNQGVGAFETLFHEVLHTMDDSLFSVVRVSFRASGKRDFHDPTHPFIFFTAGEITRRLFPGYVPFAEKAGLWTRNPDYARILPLLRAHWQPYLDGRTSLAKAVQNIVDAW